MKIVNEFFIHFLASILLSSCLSSSRYFFSHHHHYRHLTRFGCSHEDDECEFITEQPRDFLWKYFNYQINEISRVAVLIFILLLLHYEGCRRVKTSVTSDFSSTKSILTATQRQSAIFNVSPESAHCTFHRWRERNMTTIQVDRLKFHDQASLMDDDNLLSHKWALQWVNWNASRNFVPCHFELRNILYARRREGKHSQVSLSLFSRSPKLAKMKFLRCWF